MATIDNGSCSTLLAALVIRGCLDSTSKNYNPLATQNDATMCNAVTVSEPPLAGMAKGPRGESFSCIGNNRIRIFERGAVRVELLSAGGRLAWSAQGKGPCIIDIGSSLKNGIYFARVWGDGAHAGIRPMFRVADQH